MGLDYRIKVWAAALVMVLAATACSAGGAKGHYLLAERLWADGKYAAAVSEFDRTAAMDTKGKLGLQALYRSAITQSLFLTQYQEAIRKFRRFADASSDPAMAWDAEQQIGEILFEKTDQYDLAIQHYKGLLTKRPNAPEAPEFLYRISKSYFFLQQFDDAMASYRELIRKYPDTGWAEKAALELGRTAFTRGEQGSRGPEAYQEAMRDYQAFEKKYPKSPWLSEAQFGVASCLEELDQLDAAYAAFEALRTTYPSRNVIEIKLARIRERKAQRNH